GSGGGGGAGGGRGGAARGGRAPGGRAETRHACEEQERGQHHRASRGQSHVVGGGEADEDGRQGGDDGDRGRAPKAPAEAETREGRDHDHGTHQEHADHAHGHHSGERGQQRQHEVERGDGHAAGPRQVFVERDDEEAAIGEEDGPHHHGAQPGDEPDVRRTDGEDAAEEDGEKISVEAAGEADEHYGEGEAPREKNGQRRV